MSVELKIRFGNQVNENGNPFMLQFNSMREILEFAISKEKAAQSLYSSLAETMTDPIVKKVFEDLAVEETGHRQQLELELMKLGHVVTTPGSFKGARITQCVISEDISSAIGFAEALVLAMQKEKAAFRLYVELVASAENLEAREVFLTLAEEEVRHMLRFEMTYNSMMHRP